MKKIEVQFLKFDQKNYYYLPLQTHLCLLTTNSLAEVVFILRYVLRHNLLFVHPEGVEPSRTLVLGILSPVRLPIPPWVHIAGRMFTRPLPRPMNFYKYCKLTFTWLGDACFITFIFYIYYSKIFNKNQ